MSDQDKIIQAMQLLGKQTGAGCLAKQLGALAVLSAKRANQVLTELEREGKVERRYVDGKTAAPRYWLRTQGGPAPRPVEVAPPVPVPRAAGSGAATVAAVSLEEIAEVHCGPCDRKIPLHQLEEHENGERHKSKEKLFRLARVIGQEKHKRQGENKAVIVREITEIQTAMRLIAKTTEEQERRFVAVLALLAEDLANLSSGDRSDASGEN